MCISIHFPIAVFLLFKQCNERRVTYLNFHLSCNFLWPLNKSDNKATTTKPPPTPPPPPLTTTTAKTTTTRVKRKLQSWKMDIWCLSKALTVSSRHNLESCLHWGIFRIYSVCGYIYGVAWIVHQCRRLSKLCLLFPGLWPSTYKNTKEKTRSEEATVCSVVSLSMFFPPVKETCKSNLFHH